MSPVRKDGAGNDSRYDEVSIAILGMQTTGVRSILDRVGFHTHSHPRVRSR
jgi:hypothetical protein